MRAVFLAALLLTLAAPAAAQLEVRAAIEPAVIGIDETATFFIEVHGSSFSSLLFRPDFELDNLESLGAPSKYEDFQFSNGRLARTLRLSWLVRPLGLGEAGARSIAVRLNDEVILLPACELTVQREPTRSARPRPFGGILEEDDPFQQFFGRMRNPWRREPRQPEVFLKAEIHPPNPVAGQQVVYEIYLYTREDISALAPSGVPTFRGFWVRDIPIPQHLPTEMIEVDGRRYGRVPLLRKALFPLRSGRYEIEPATVDLSIQRYDRGFPFGPVSPRPEGLRLRTTSQWIDVQPLPSAPPDFHGTVGRLALTADLQPQRVPLGEAAILTVRLMGEGHLQGVQHPAVVAPPGVNVLPPQQEGKDEISGSTVRGSRIWKYAVVPDRAGRYRLETPEVTYYDPVARQYRVAAAPDLTLTALPRPAETARAGSGPSHGIRSAVPSGPTAVWHGTRLLGWLFVLPWGLALIVTLVRRRSRHPEPALSRPPGGAPPLQSFEEDLRQAEAEERPRQTAARIEDAWRGLLAASWQLPSALPPARWLAALADRGMDTETLDELGRVIEDLQYLRHAPQLSTTDTLKAEVISRCRRLASRLP